MACGKEYREVWRADEAVGEGEDWCGGCGTGHKIEGAVLVAVCDTGEIGWVRESKWWNRSPSGCLLVARGGTEEL